MHPRRCCDEENQLTTAAPPATARKLIFGAVPRRKIEQHDDEKEEHHHRAGVDEHLDDADEEGIERDEERRQAEEADDQAERAGHRVAIDDDRCPKMSMSRQRRARRRIGRHFSKPAYFSRSTSDEPDARVPPISYQLLLVVHHLGAREAGDGVVFAQKDRLLRADFFAHAAVDAADHVDVEFLRALLDFGQRSPDGISPGMILIARGGQMNSQSWQATQRSRPCSSVTRVGAPR